MIKESFREAWEIVFKKKKSKLKDKEKNEVKRTGRITVRKHPTEVGYEVCKNGIPVRRKYGQYTASAYFRTKKEAKKYADKLRK